MPSATRFTLAVCLLAVIVGTSRRDFEAKPSSAAANPHSKDQGRTIATEGNKMIPAKAEVPFSAVRGGFVAIVVPNLDESAQWYVSKLGLKIVKDHAMRPDRTAAVTILQANGFVVELVWFQDAEPLSKVAPHLKGSHELHGIFKAGFVVDDLDSTWKELRSRGVPAAFEPFYDKSMDCRMFAIRDNNGNILQFFGK